MKSKEKNNKLRLMKIFEKVKIALLIMIIEIFLKQIIIFNDLCGQKNREKK